MNNTEYYENLRTINNYAKDCGVTYAAIVKRIRSQAIIPVKIDGVQFIDIAVYPPRKGRRT
jgi:hypothetical protein